MFNNFSRKHSGKVLGWLACALLINFLIVSSLQTALLLPDYGGMAFAQTGPPDDTPTPIPTAPVGDIIIDVDNSITVDDSGRGRESGNDGTAELKPTPTFTPLSFTPISPPLVVTETIFVEVTPALTPTPPSDVTPTPSLDYSACGLVSIAGVPPTGLPSLAGNGVIFQIPPAPGEAFLQVTTNLGNGVCNCTLAVPTSSTQCKVAEIDQDPALVLDPPAPVPESVRMLVPFYINIFGVNDLQNVVKITSHAPPLVFTTDPLDVADGDKVVLLRYDEVEQRYKLPQQEYDPSTKILQAFLPNTSFFVLGTLGEQPTSQELIAPESALPAGLPPGSEQPVSSSPSILPEPATTPDQSLLGLFLAILAGLIGVVALFLLLGGGRALKSMLRASQPPPMAERERETGGLALAFGLQMPDVTPLVSVSLASLPSATAAQTALPQTSPSTGLDLPSVEVSASIRAAKPGLLRVHQAVTVPAEVTLAGWNELGLRPRKLSYTVLVGHLDWYGPDEIFARLHELEPGDVFALHSQPNIYYQYIVDEVQSYQADTTSVVGLSGATAGVQLVLIAWSEAYDVEAQEYRDYIVIQAHLNDASLIDRLEMSRAETLARQAT